MSKRCLLVLLAHTQSLAYSMKKVEFRITCSICDFNAQKSGVVSFQLFTLTCLSTFFLSYCVYHIGKRPPTHDHVMTNSCPSHDILLYSEEFRKHNNVAPASQVGAETEKVGGWGKQMLDVGPLTYQRHSRHCRIGEIYASLLFPRYINVHCRSTVEGRRGEGELEHPLNLNVL